MPRISVTCHFCKYSISLPLRSLNNATSFAILHDHRSHQLWLNSFNMAHATGVLESYLLPANKPEYFALKSHRFLFTDGDVIIRLGKSHEDIFVVHSEVLIEHSPWFKAMFEGEFLESRTIEVGGKARSIWELDLYFDYELKLGLLKHKVCLLTCLRSNC